MLKLNASYSKKVPAETEYSSQSYHASIEVEIPDGLTRNSFRAASMRPLILCGTASKRNCMAVIVRLYIKDRNPRRVIPAARAVTAREKAVRMLMVLRLRNRSSICSTSQETPMSRLSRSRQGSG